MAGTYTISGVLDGAATNVGISVMGELGITKVGVGDVGAEEIGVDGGGELRPEAELLSDVRESGSDSIVGVRRCTWNIDGWIEFIERVRSESFGTFSGSGTSDGDGGGENERAGMDGETPENSRNTYSSSISI